MAHHPYRTGNYAPCRRESHLAGCFVRLGSVPDDLAGGQYVRNGSNPLGYEGDATGRDMHWFDGHGMLSAVYFSVPEKPGATIMPLFSNRFVRTDVFLAEAAAASPLRVPLLPSIATMLQPSLRMYLRLARCILSLLLTVLLSLIPGSRRQSIRRISVANTHIVRHGGRFLATCESGPPIRIRLPELATVGWFNGLGAEGEPRRGVWPGGHGWRAGLLGFLREWTTAHPHVDPQTGEMVLFHSTFVRPYVRYSVLAGAPHPDHGPTPSRRLPFNSPVPGVRSARMMHDLGVSRRHTVIIDMPLSLDPFQLLRGRPVVAFDRTSPTRFGVFPRHEPAKVRWLVSAASCCIFHTVNTWDDPAAVHMLVCRMGEPSIVYATGGLPTPTTDMDDATLTARNHCRLFYYQFRLDQDPAVAQQWALSAIPFEFPHVPGHVAMSAARFVYGCSVRGGTYAEQLANTMKIGSLVKIDVAVLIARGLKQPPAPTWGCVDERTVDEILADDDDDDAIRIFVMPEGHYAQECVFVPRKGGCREDDGWLLTFVFDEAQLDDFGNAPDDARSELWIIDARSMRDVVARVVLPQRVPYGLHGSWFPREELENQRPVATFRESKA
ncbi:hypothetical protein CDD80_3960 [Ophiocordyceps camponoti-rufipedis]|uniref:Carotenoid oxygenase n=1 Tax=Ophiocordyceps camponoti-rufipedis TaxID=2004952 RepID=A0A2C5ZFB6_9HYPO|nr:hypothetical protein CDD80_3960 [Ophiocordyceps camponoti-rufipedis]